MRASPEMASGEGVAGAGLQIVCELFGFLLIIET